MKRSLVAQVLLFALLSLSACSGGAGRATKAGGNVSAPPPGPGWTGVTNPTGVIEARCKLMQQIEQLMLPIDMLEVEDGGDSAVISANAAAMAAMLQAVPHLFPPTTNLYDPKAETPLTIALPAIWQHFGTFYNLASASATAASNMAAAEGGDAQRAAGAALRGTCDGCHALFLRKYEKPKVQASDTNFDFDAALPGK